jgi:hypothetical protein
MSYVNYDLSLYRQGYRPYGETDPFAATMLSGVKPTPAGHPFAPWRLRGMGQNPPFTESGGYKLHGLAGVTASFLGSMGGVVPDGSIVTYVGKWTPTYTMGAQDLITAVSSALQQKWGLGVVNVSSDAGIADTTIVGLTIQPTPFNVQLQIQVNTGKGGFGDPSDIAKIVAGEVYAASGSMPLSGSIPVVNTPGAGAQPPAGSVGLECLVADPTNPACASVAPTNWGTWLQQNAVWLGLGVAGLVLIPRLLR